MDEPSDEPPPGVAPTSTTPADAVGEALRTAVERTLAVTADSATETRQRAQGLLDDVVRRGQVARREVTKRGEEASARLVEAISDLRTAEGEGLDEMAGRLEAIEGRLASLEAHISLDSNPRVEAEKHPADPHGQRQSEG